MFVIKVSSSPAGKAPPFFICWPEGQQTPRAGESDAENRETLLTDFPERFSRFCNRGRGIAIRIEWDRNETGDGLVAGDWLTRKCLISGDFGDLICARGGGEAAGWRLALMDSCDSVE